MNKILMLLAYTMLLAGCATGNTKLMGSIDKIGLESRQDPKGVIVELPSVFFEFGQYNLSSDGRSATAQLAGIINGSGAAQRTLSISGFTDGVGTDEDNLTLSKNRAKAVFDEFIFSRVDRVRVISVQGYGEQQPLMPNSKPDGSDNPEGRAKHRRVEVLIAN